MAAVRRLDVLASVPNPIGSSRASHATPSAMT
jgi:hypothetical protein